MCQCDRSELMRGMCQGERGTLKSKEGKDGDRMVVTTARASDRERTKKIISLNSFEFLKVKIRMRSLCLICSLISVLIRDRSAKV